MRRAQRLRQVVNAVNLSTPLGLALASAGTRRTSGLTRAPGGLIVAGGYRLPLPAAHAFTVGDVVLFRGEPAELLERPRLLRHEGRHALQYALFLGPVMIPLYLVCAGVSKAVCGDYASYNPFERLAGLDDGGYTRRAPRWRT
ncbi:hypothetical protein [Spirillospora sp. CA-294931]|uniref:hypothetical protein n=1 Tax=Spirillospora sp. CA-294931 TaxID=3240042 RepID=UPI003D8DFE22